MRNQKTKLLAGLYVLAIYILFFVVIPNAEAQRNNTIYADQFPGTTVGEKVKAAQLACIPDAAIPCFIVIEPTLAKASEGVMPAKCAQCYWEDFRTGLPPFSGNVWLKSLNGTLYADQFAGADIGEKINAAYASCPANGCRIRVPAGWYDYATPIVLNTSAKSVVLECDGDVQPATVLHYYALTGTAVTLANGQGKMIRGCQIKGPTSGTTTGLYLTDVVLGGLDAVDISYFTTGMIFGSNTYVENFNRVMIHDNTQNINVPAGLTNFGENIVFSNSDIYQPAATAMQQNCFYIASGVFTFAHSSIDQCGVLIDGYNAGVTMLGGHLENSNTTLPFVKFGPSAQSSMFHAYGTKWWENGNNAGRTEFILEASTGTNVDNEVLVVGGTISAGGETVAQFANSTHACCSVASVYNLINGATGSAITNLIGGNWANGYSSMDKGKAIFSNGAKLPSIKSTTGNRYVCVDNAGNLVSQAAACSGT